MPYLPPSVAEVVTSRLVTSVSDAVAEPEDPLLLFMEFTLNE